MEKVIPASKPIVKEIEKPIPTPKPVVKPVSKPEVVPAPYMETTLDIPVQKEVVLETKSKPVEIEKVAEAKPAPTADAQKQLNNILEAEAISFEGTSNLISEKSKITLQKIIKLINTLDNQEIKISGFTDFSSDKVYNKVLSQKRADTVMRYLKNSAIKSKHIKSIGYGDAKHGNGENVAIEIEILGETK